MKKFVITYVMYPDPNIVVTYYARSYEDAVVFAKGYRKDSFSVEEVAEC